MSQLAVRDAAPTRTDPHGPPRAMSRLTGVTGSMVGAELLKVRKRRGLVAFSAILTVGVVTVAYAVMAILHAANPGRYGPAGGISNLSGVMGVLGILGSVAAIMIGATAGAGDLQSAVFRDLVATGRPRLALFAARIPGGLMLLWPLVAVAWTIACIASVVFAATLPLPAVSTMLAGGAWVLLAVTTNYVLALGVASSTGSRTAAVAQVFAWQFILSNLLVQIAALGAWRHVIEMVALTRLMPEGLRGGSVDPVSASMSAGVAILVVATWMVLPLALGAWRTVRRDA